MAKLVIRNASVNDIPSIVRVSLTASTIEEARGFSAPEWTTYLTPEELTKIWVEENRLKDGFEVVVAEKDENVVGFIVFKQEHDHFYIDNIDVTKNEQGKGIGKALVSHVENIAIANGYALMKTDTTENAEGISWKSYGFWTKMGYIDTGERLPTKWDFKTIPFGKNLKCEGTVHTE